MTDKELTTKSKFLSLVLRHKPEEIGIKLSEEGWANTQELCKLSHITRSELEEIVEKNNKKRFEFDKCKDRIRACQGHSVDVDLKLKPVEPPVFLYHGTSDKFLKSIRKEGLKAGDRNHVYLSEDRETAEKVGSRHGGKTIVLRVKADEYKYNNEDVEFYKSTNGVWLTKEVPAEYIVFPFELKFEKTCRGFEVGNFKDSYGTKCSIQESSSAEEAHIWLGCDDANPRILACHVNGGVANGWVDYPVHPEASFTTRMHLTVEMAEALIPILQKFVKTGGL